MRQTMECAYPHSAGWIAQNVFNSTTHFSGSFVGKGNSKNIARRETFSLNQPGDTMN